MRKGLNVVFGIALLILVALAGCEEPPEPISEKYVSWEEPIAYAYYESRAKTNNRGGVYKHIQILHLGIVKDDGSVCEHEYSEHNCPSIYMDDSDRLIHFNVEYTYEDGHTDIGYSAWDEIHLTKETLQEIGKNN